jgi:CRP/FNR family transcriptional regulator, cyclic AMP receptor protein
MSSESQIRRTSQACTSCEHRTLRMFCNLSPEELEDFDKLGTPLRLPKGAVVFREEESSHSVAVICDGQVKLSCTSREGKTMILKIAVAGDVLGLGAVISGSRHETTAETLEPTMIKSIKKDEFLSFLQRHGEASMHAARSLSDEYKSVFFDARRLALSPTAAGRLASVLLDWGRTASCGKPGMRFTMALTHEELANLAGTSRETVTRTLGKFQREKLIQVRGVSLTILDPERLAQIAS